MSRLSVFAALALSLALLLGCAPDFEPASTLNSLRVLAVQKDKPYAHPGDTVTLRMLFDDAAPGGPRPIEVFWLGGACEDPPGDSYTGCVELFAPKPGAAPATGPFGLPDTVKPGKGPVFTTTLSPTIISRRPPPVNPKQPRYGASFVFFTACAGHLDFAPAGEFDPVNNPGSLPFACYSPSNKRLGQGDFIAGYTEIFASDTITNANPIVTGFEVDGQGVVPECTGAGCIPEGEQSPGGDAGLPDGAAPSGEGGLDAAFRDAGVIDAGRGRMGAGTLPEKDPCASSSPSAACIDVCTEDRKDCPRGVVSACCHDIKLLVDPKSDEIDAVAKALEGQNVFEQMWVNYYADAGKIPTDVKLLGDATLGYHDEHQTRLLAPKTKGIFHVWAVAHDNRGGAQWVRVAMSAR